jgi:hypothetical protein
MSRSDLSVVIVSWNTQQLLRDCLTSLSRHLASIEHEVIVVDNASTDGSAEMVQREFEHVRLIQNEDNTGFGAANNQAMAVAEGRYFLLLNSDTYLRDDSVAKLCRKVMSHPDIGVAQCQLYFPDGRIQYTAHRFPSLGRILFEALGVYKLMPGRAPKILLRGYWNHQSERDVDWVIGAFMLLPRQVFQATGGFDERLFMYGEDREWCFRIRRRGWRIRYYPEASIVHIGHASANLGLGERRLALCLQRDQEFYVEQFGRGKALVMMVALIIGSAARVAYYAARVRAGGAQAGGYQAMQPEVNATLRILTRLALGQH